MDRSSKSLERGETRITARILGKPNFIAGIEIAILKRKKKGTSYRDVSELPRRGFLRLGGAVGGRGGDGGPLVEEEVGSGSVAIGSGSGRVVGGGKGDPPLLPFPHRSAEDRRRPIASRRPAQTGPHPLHCNTLFCIRSLPRVWVKHPVTMMPLALRRLFRASIWCGGGGRIKV